MRTSRPRPAPVTTSDLPDEPPACPGDSDCCADLHRKVDRLLELLEDRRKPATCKNRYAVTSFGRTVEYIDCPQPRPCLIHDRPRGYTLAQMVDDLIQRYERDHISEEQLRQHITERTGIRFPQDE